MKEILVPSLSLEDVLSQHYGLPCERVEPWGRITPIFFGLFKLELAGMAKGPLQRGTVVIRPCRKVWMICMPEDVCLVAPTIRESGVEFMLMTESWAARHDIAVGTTLVFPNRVIHVVSDKFRGNPNDAASVIQMRFGGERDGRLRLCVEEDSLLTENSK